MMLQKKLKASWTRKSSRLRDRRPEGAPDRPGRANAHQGEQDHPYDGKHDAWRGKRRLGNDLGIELCTVPGQPAGQAAHRLGEEDPSPIGPP